MTKQEALKWFQLRKKMCLSDRTQEAEDIAIECIASVMAQEPQTVSGWVSVEDRLPEDEQDVLAYLNNGEETRIAPCNYYNGVWFDSVMNCVVVLQDVTHWMPLPKPPEEGK